MSFVFVVVKIVFILITQDTCYPYLDSEKVYYLGDTEWFDDPRTMLGFSMVTSVFGIIKNIMNPGRVRVKVKLKMQVRVRKRVMVSVKVVMMVRVRVLVRVREGGGEGEGEGEG